MQIFLRLRDLAGINIPTFRLRLQDQETQIICTEMCTLPRPGTEHSKPETEMERLRSSWSGSTAPPEVCLPWFFQEEAPYRRMIILDLPDLCRLQALHPGCHPGWALRFRPSENQGLKSQKIVEFFKHLSFLSDENQFLAR